MALSNAERQRKFRQNRDRNCFKREEYLQYERERYKKDKLLKKKKCVKDMSLREQRAIRKKWRNAKQKERKNKKKLSNAIITPPNSPTENLDQSVRSSKREKRQQSKCYRDNEKLRLEVLKQKKICEKYKKKLIRLREENKDNNNKDSPRTTTRKLLRHISKKTVKRTLLFHNALICQIKNSYKLQNNNFKRKVSQLLSGSILKKYKFRCVALKLCGVNTRPSLKYKTSLSRRLCTGIKTFFERDDVSRITTGLKQTLTKNKHKKQRRILSDNLHNTYLKYISETSNKLSFTTFCRLRPFWVRPPTNADRNTCMCKLCENTDFLVSALHNISKIDSDKNKLVESIVCDTNSLMCMHGKCVDCENIKLETVESQLDEVEWCEWQNKVETRKIKVGKREEIKEVKITVKEKVKGSISQLIEQTEMQLDRYRKHMFTIKKQFDYYKKKKESLGKNECLMQVDFSENYICKLSSKIHSMHFGASKKQLSLQTGVYFIGQNSKPFTFCTVSENLHHGPGGVWGHLRPILKRR
ncbi:hypothetical protein SNE40_005324 [Patella caerulea]|uniref:Uncharacterized protein n=1 Tax=Patella caerulea TaxID=87958 RepID=A0AAN8PXB6_PATCE